MKTTFILLNSLTNLCYFVAGLFIKYSEKGELMVEVDIIYFDFFVIILSVITSK